MTPRRPAAKAVRERPAVDPSEGLDHLVDDEANDEEEQLGRSRSVVRPIRDEPDHLVFRFEVGPRPLRSLSSLTVILGTGGCFGRDVRVLCGM